MKLDSGWVENLQKLSVSAKNESMRLYRSVCTWIECLILWSVGKLR